MESEQRAADLAFDPLRRLEREAQLDRYDRLRAHDGIVEVMPGVFFTARSADVCAVARDPQTFRQGGYSLEEHDLSDDERVLSETDPPLHTAVRQAFMNLITNRRMAAYEALVMGCFRDAVQRLAPVGKADLVNDIARVVPPRIIGILANVGEEMLGHVQSYGADYAAAKFLDDAAAAVRVADFDRHVLGLIRERRAAGGPGEDWLSVLLECSDHEGRPLSDERLATMFTKDVLVGGSGTVGHVMSQLFLTILTHDGLADRLRSNRRLVPGAVEEALRVWPTLPVLLRRATRDVELDGTKIPEGSVVALGLEAGNFDPAVFSDPRQFVVDRGVVVRRHLTFGHGAHHCLGAPLARMELTACLNAVLDGLPSLQLAPGFIEEYDPRNRLTHLDVVFDATSTAP